MSVTVGVTAHLQLEFLLLKPLRRRRLLAEQMREHSLRGRLPRGQRLLEERYGEWMMSRMV